MATMISVMTSIVTMSTVFPLRFMVVIVASAFQM